MSTHQTAVYYAWSRPAEIGAPLAVIDDRFPALLESRRMLYPRLQELADPGLFDQGIAGFLDHVMRTASASFGAASSTALANHAEMLRLTLEG